MLGHSGIMSCIVKEGISPTNEFFSRTRLYNEYEAGTRLLFAAIFSKAMSLDMLHNETSIARGIFRKKILGARMDRVHGQRPH